MSDETAPVAAPPTVETADAATGSERAVVNPARVPFVAREHIAPEPGHRLHERQPGEVIQADGTREPESPSVVTDARNSASRPLVATSSDDGSSVIVTDTKGLRDAADGPVNQPGAVQE